MAGADGIFLEIDPVSVKKLEYSFLALGKRVVKKILRKEAKLALKPMMRTMRTNAPVRSGLLRKSIGIQVKAYANALWAAVGPRHGFRAVITNPERGGTFLANPIGYARLVEYGTRPHSVIRGTRLMRRKGTPKPGETPAGDIPRGPGRHPGTAPRPFMRKAYEAHRSSAVQAFADGVVKSIEAAWAELVAGQATAA